LRGGRPGPPHTRSATEGAAKEARLPYLIQTVAANATQVDVTYELAGDLCFEVYACNAAGESAPAYYCTGF